MLTPIKSKFMSNPITGSKGHRYRAISWALCRGMDAKKIMLSTLHVMATAAPGKMPRAPMQFNSIMKKGTWCVRITLFYCRPTQHRGLIKC
jgi:hypothetical protein